jgi:hypothetical protein
MAFPLFPCLEERIYRLQGGQQGFQFFIVGCASRTSPWDRQTSTGESVCTPGVLVFG